MGIIKTMFSIFVFPVRFTTGRERSRMYQRQTNALLEEILTTQQFGYQNVGQVDLRPRATCPACLEMILVGATTCPHCKTAGITWPETAVPTLESSSSTPVPLDTPSLEEYWMREDQKLNAERKAWRTRNREEEKRRISDLPPEVVSLRDEIASVTRRRDKLRQRLKDSDTQAKCASCGEGLISATESCLQCEYLRLRGELDRLKQR